MKFIAAFFVCLLCLQLHACNRPKVAAPTGNPSDTDTMTIKITVGANVFTATLSDNKTAAAFKALLPLTLDMTELNNNEKYADLPGNLPINASNPGTIQNGDLLLYGSRTIVLFYKTFSTSYTYTRIGRVDNPSGWAAALGAGNATVKVEVE